MTKNVRILSSGLSLLAILFLVSCATDSTQRPTLVPVAEKIAMMDFAGTKLDFDLTVNNPTAHSLAVQGYTYKFVVAGKEIISDRLKAKANVAAGEPWQRTLTVDLRSGRIEGLVGHHQGATLPYELSGTVFAADHSGYLKLPIHVTGELKLLRKPEFALENLKVENLTRDGATLRFEVTVQNPNPFATNFSSVSADLILDGQTFAQEVALTIPPLGTGAATRVPMTLTVRFAALGGNARPILEKKKVNYTMASRATFTTPWGEKKITYERSGIAQLAPGF